MRLGEGRAGFIVYPAIPCPGKDTTGYVSKVFQTWTDQVTYGTTVHEAGEYFEEVKNRLTSVLVTLKEMDPNQEHFLYPEFCEVGELTDENRADGVTDENKHYSYLIKKGGEKTLAEVANSEISREVFVKYLKQICEKVDLLHKHKILHDDLVPQNVLRMEDGTFRIIDFDTSRTVSVKDLEDIQYAGGFRAPSKVKEAMDEEFQYLVEIACDVGDFDYDSVMEDLRTISTTL